MRRSVLYFLTFLTLSLALGGGVKASEDVGVATRFFVFGHVYTDYDAVELAVKKINVEKPDFVIFLGDTLPPHHQDEWSDVLAITDRINVPVHFVVGNHDIEDRVGDKKFFEENIDKLYKSFTVGGIDFITLNSSNIVPLANFDVSGDQVNWFKNVYKQSLNPKIIFVHHCLFYQDNGSLCNNRGSIVSEGNSWNSNIVPVIKADALAVFTGDVGTQQPYYSYKEESVQYYGVGFGRDRLKFPQHYLDVRINDSLELQVTPVIIRDNIASLNSLEKEEYISSFRERLPKLSYERFRIVGITYAKKLIALFALSTVIFFVISVWLYRKKR